MKNIIENLIRENKTIEEIAKVIKLSKTGTRYWIKKYGLKTNRSDFQISEKWSEQNLKSIIKESETKSDIIKKLNLKIRAGNYKTLDKYIKFYNLDISHFNRYIHKNRFNNKKYSDEEIFIKESKYTSNKQIKNRLKKYKNYKCEKCENGGTWSNEKLELQLDHINGINNDNRLENLRFLCPNCHSQTDTFCSKKVK